MLEFSSIYYYLTLTIEAIYLSYEIDNSLSKFFSVVKSQN